MNGDSVPKISVVMPVYNGASFIGKAIESLFSQSFQDWELVVVDDGSTDATPQILAEYTDARMRILRQANTGEAGARNTGLNHVRGDYLAFLDADDEYLPDALKELSGFLDRNPQFDVVFSDGHICDEDDRHLMRLTDVRPGIHTGRILDALVMSPSVVTVPVCTMLRSATMRRYGLRFDETSNLIGTDWDFWIRLAVHAEFGYLDKPTCNYRIHIANITRTTGAEKRRTDYVYCRMKIFNSDWFEELSLTTKERFLFDLLTRALSGDAEKQKHVLESNRCGGLPASVRSFLWRSVGTDILQNDPHIDRARSCFEESLRIEPDSVKTRLLLWGASFGRPFVLVAVKLWRLVLRIRRGFVQPDPSASLRLQRLLGVHEQ
jgi:glycosyltransferase involved in cell wall biosynthesis